ncbi:glycoside hydrolase family 10 protein [Rhodonellum sp.]|uniref:glycoside hydrolase family 10 protein n=1 Tax=Rhodonellum sp. TaxID=2231180 RepID=UPI0027248E51|nr:family 10 glycosylhydrolase [Rhodonellum sp.]MDO9551516.1 family 10 glycosylhydrolase [Rhodonellum sp.]
MTPLFLSKSIVNNNLLKALILGFIFLVLGACASKQPIAKTGGATATKPIPVPAKEPAPIPLPSLPEIPKNKGIFKVWEVDMVPSKREFRGIWIATVGNIDWPSSSRDPFSKQKTDFINLLDYYQKMNFNAVIVQIRTSGDAFYPSRLAPWSKYLTGKEGQKPLTDEDPLAWMILEAHKRGMEFHAWFNPYRATVDLDLKKLSPEHDYFKHPEWMIKYSNKYYYNPGLPAVQQHLTEVIREVVQNYDVDAVHFDDYFYPYKVDKLVFDDLVSYKKHATTGQKLEDWRRENVNKLISAVHQAIKYEKPWVQFGVSPFGVWRNNDKDPNGSKTRATSNFDDLYADPITWMKNGWIDYLIPQLYWSMDYNLASYRELVQWWSKNNHATKIYIGNSPYKIRDNADQAWNDPLEIPKQIDLTRTTSNISGNAYFSARSLFVINKDVAEHIRINHYNKPASPPQFTPRNRMQLEDPETPTIVPHKGGFALQYNARINVSFRYALIHSAANLKTLSERSALMETKKVYLGSDNRTLIPLESGTNKKFIAISLVDHFGRESTPAVFEIY